MFAERVLSGMRPTGNLHLGHYHGVLKNWVRLQSEYPCFFFVADWHALTTHYETPDVIEQSVWDMAVSYTHLTLPTKASSAASDVYKRQLFIAFYGHTAWMVRARSYL